MTGNECTMTAPCSVSPWILSQSSLDHIAALPILSQSSPSQGEDSFELASSPSPVARRTRRPPRLSVVPTQQSLVVIKRSARNKNRSKRDPLQPRRVKAVRPFEDARGKENAVQTPATTPGTAVRQRAETKSSICDPITTRNTAQRQGLVALWNQKYVNVRIVVENENENEIFPQQEPPLQSGWIDTDTIPTANTPATDQCIINHSATGSPLKSLHSETRRNLKANDTPMEPNAFCMYAGVGNTVYQPATTTQLRAEKHPSIVHPITSPSTVQQTDLVAIWNEKHVKVRIVVAIPVTKEEPPTTGQTSQTLHNSSQQGEIDSEKDDSPSNVLPSVNGTDNTPTDQSTTSHGTSLLKSLLAETRRNVKADGTPAEPKDRHVYEDDNDEVDNILNDALLPSVSRSQPASPMAANKADAPSLSATIGVSLLNERMHALFPSLQREKEGKVGGTHTVAET
jgi:hypothetical protein